MVPILLPLLKGLLSRQSPRAVSSCKIPLRTTVGYMNYRKHQTLNAIVHQLLQDDLHPCLDETRIHPILSNDISFRSYHPHPPSTHYSPPRSDHQFATTKNDVVFRQCLTFIPINPTLLPLAELPSRDQAIWPGQVHYKSRTCRCYAIKVQTASFHRIVSNP
jgi:hypothetical protein